MGLMKKYNQFLKELPSKTVVFAFGRFNPPTNGHELLVKVVKKLATAKKADHAIYASKSQDAKKNPLTVDKKVHYLNLMFPHTNFVAATTDVPTFIQAAKQLNKKYKNIVMVAGSDRIPEYTKILNRYNGTEFHFDTIELVSAGERDPDADDASGMSASKMRSLASKGDYHQFKTGLPSSLRDIDGKRLMNDVRHGMGLDPIKEQVKFDVDTLREKFFRGEIFNVGDIVESAGETFEIMDRGPNYVTVVDTSGNLSKKWIQNIQQVGDLQEDIKPGYAPKEISFKGYTSKNLHHSEDAAKAFQDTISRKEKEDPVAILNALKATDAYMGLNDKHLTGEEVTQQELETWATAHENARKSLDRIGEFAHHEDYWHMHLHELEGVMSDYKNTGKEEFMGEELTNKTIKSTDKIKVARIISNILGVTNVESSSNPEALVNSALRKVKTKALNAESLSILEKMLALATEVGINYDSTLKPSKLKEDTVATNSNYNIAKDKLRYKDFVKLKAMNSLKPGESLVHSDEDDTVRKQKIKHHLGEETEECEVAPTPVTTVEIPDSHSHETFEGEEHDSDEMSEEELDKMADQVNDMEDVIDVYEDDELSIVDGETGEEIEMEESVNEEALNEVLSRMERMRAKMRFARTKAKRVRAEKIALKRYSDNKTINKRSRRLAVNLMKKRLLRGRNATTLSVGEKERIERIIERRKSAIGRLAMKLAPRIRKIEKARMSHSKFTQASPSVAM